jgi:hypothetical protein
MANPLMSLLGKAQQNQQAQQGKLSSLLSSVSQGAQRQITQAQRSFARSMADDYLREREQALAARQKEPGIDRPVIDPIDWSQVPNDTRQFLNRLGQIESSNNYNIKPNKYGYEGKYQFRFRPGDDGLKYAKQLGVSPDVIRRSPELQDRMMMLAIKDYSRQLRSAGIPVNNFTLWLRHNQGLRGTREILSGNISNLVQRNISTNLPKGMAPTAQNYLSYWRRKWGIN